MILPFYGSISEKDLLCQRQTSCIARHDVTNGSGGQDKHSLVMQRLLFLTPAAVVQNPAPAPPRGHH